MKKVTFTLDASTVAYLGRTAARLGIPKSQVVREAIRVYGEQAARLSSAERDRMLEAFDEVTSGIPDRPRSGVEAELDELRTARRAGGRGAGVSARPAGEDDGG
ncbi:MAG: ribbon-helix-helix protein, CopG family [Longimicrobiales bacterium]|nr:ribbon-helix-helix protein, CopG family [Longimicrobiales bacterium]